MSVLFSDTFSFGFVGLGRLWWLRLLDIDVIRCAYGGCSETSARLDRSHLTGTRDSKSLRYS